MILKNADHDFVSFCSFRHSDWQFFRTLAFSLSPPRLATLDQPLAKGFADETGLVELLR